MTVGHFLEILEWWGGGSDLEDALDQQRANIAPPLVKSAP